MSAVEYKKMRVDEMRDQLLQLGYTAEEVESIKGKANLAKALEEEASISVISSLDFGTEKNDGDFEPEEKGEVTIMEATQDETVIPPRISDPEWSDYVLSKFEYDEMVDGNPTVDGLRRVTELLLGNIVEVNTEIIQAPTKENEGRATATCTVSVMTSENQSRSACGSGDSWHKNTDMPYSKFPVAMAETRAEGRALRRVLQLRKVVAAEELSDNANEETEDYSTDVNDNQINFIDIMCKSIGRGLDINIETLVKANHPNLKSIRHLTYSQATSLIQKLSHYQQNMETIPENIKGYDSNWRNSFDGS
jgi:hypothetical protein